MQIFVVEQHVPTVDAATGEPIGKEFTGSDIRHVVYWDTDRERAEQYADVANLTCIKPYIRGYLVRATDVDL